MLGIRMHLETRVLVTGGAGFLGSHLCEKLLNEIVDDLLSGFMRLMEAPSDVNGPINLGKPGEYKISRSGQKGDRSDEFAIEDYSPAPARG